VTTPADPAGPVQRGAWPALVLATLAFTACFYAWSLLGPLGPELQEELGLTDFQLSVMVSVPVLLGALMRIPLGALTDRYGGRVVFTALMAYVPVPLIGLALLHESFAAVLALGFLLGFAGASFAVGVPFVSRWFPPERQGAALGIYGVGMGGTVLGGLTAPAIADQWGLAAPFTVAAVLVGAGALTFALIGRDAPARPVAATSRPRMFASLAVFRTSSRAWALTLFYFLTFGGFVAMFLYLPKLLTGVHDLTATDAGARAAGFALLTVVGRPLGGWLSDRVGAERVLQAALAATVVLALVLAAGYQSMAALTFGCLSLALALGLGTGAVFKLVAEWFPQQVGGVTGVVGAAGGLGGFFPPLVMGVVHATTGGYFIGFALMAAVGGASLLVLRAVHPTPRAVMA
jgi:MFS transporter, NNP family, nitrate/nitrite transporter